MKEKGLTGYQLKLIGLVLMVFDHIFEFFSYTNRIPIAFRWMGRIVAPIFIFMTVEGYVHTRSKKKYMLRLYLASIFMNVGNLILPKYFERADNIALMNNVFATLFMILVYLSIVDFIRKAIKDKKIGKVFLGKVLFTIPFVISILIAVAASVGKLNVVRLMYIIPTPIFVEGGPVFILLGIIMYLLRENKKNMIIVYSVISLAIMLLGELSLSGIFMRNFQWMMVFAAPFFYLYNGEKGKGAKYLFYIFYPAHIYIFYIASSLMMNR